MGEKFTAAEELKNILIKFSKLGGGTQSGMRIGDYLAAEFGMEKSEVNSLRAFARIIQLCDRVIDDVGSLGLEDKHQSRLEEDIKKIVVKIVAIGPIHPVSHWVSNIPVQFIELLTYIEISLSGRVSYLVLDDEVAELKELLSALQQSIVDSNLPPEFKEAAAKRLYDIEVALTNLKIWGTDGLNDAVILLCGEIVVSASYNTDVKESNAWKKLTNFAGRALDLVGKTKKIVNNSENIIESASNLAEKLENFGS